MAAKCKFVLLVCMEIVIKVLVQPITISEILINNEWRVITEPLTEFYLYNSCIARQRHFPHNFCPAHVTTL